MKYLRMAIWLRRNAPPMTTVIAEGDLKVPIYVAATQQRELMQQTPGLPVDIEVHEYPDELSLVDVTLKLVADRPRPLTKEERDELTVFEWGVALLEQLRPDGIAQTTTTAPLDTDTLSAILLRVAASPKYRNQTFNMTAHNGISVQLVRGAIVLGKLN